MRQTRSYQRCRARRHVTERNVGGAVGGASEVRAGRFGRGRDDVVGVPTAGTPERVASELVCAEEAVGQQKEEMGGHTERAARTGFEEMEEKGKRKEVRGERK